MSPNTQELRINHGSEFCDPLTACWSHSPPRSGFNTASPPASLKLLPHLPTQQNSRSRGTFHASFATQRQRGTHTPYILTLGTLVDRGLRLPTSRLRLLRSFLISSEPFALPALELAFCLSGLLTHRSAACEAFSWQGSYHLHDGQIGRPTVPKHCGVLAFGWAPTFPALCASWCA